MLKSRIHSLAAAATALPLALAATLAAAPSPAAAAGLSVRTEVVQFDDLDLTNEKAIAKLKRRVGHAITRVCGPDLRMSVNDRRTYRVCADAARADAHAQIEQAVQVALLTRGRPLTTAHR